MNDVLDEIHAAIYGLGIFTALKETLRRATAEIERLREGYEQCRATLKHVAADRDQKETEVQCLRDRLLPYIDYADGIPAGYGEDEIDRQRAEIDRLRQELNQCLHLDHHNAIVANLNGEITRLRRTLSVIAGGFAPAAEIAQEALGE